MSELGCHRTLYSSYMDDNNPTDSILPRHLFHYTSMSVLLNIVKNLKDGNFTFWASSLDYMNDGAEYMESRNLCEDITEEVIMDHFLGAPFALCFSEREDNIPMWHMYANRGRGVCLDFDFAKLSNYFEIMKKKDCRTTKFDKCKYHPIEDKKMAMMDENYNNESIESTGLRNTMVDSSFVKPTTFEHEREWRLMIWESQISYPNRNIKFRERNEAICPYVEVIIPANNLMNIIVGPCADSDSVESIRLLLGHSFEKNTIQVVKSDLTLKI